jgi:hypothetical protein
MPGTPALGLSRQNMKIDSTGSTRSTSTVRRNERGPGGKPGDFLRHLESGSGNAAVNGPKPMSAMDGLLALQEVDDSTERRARSRKRGDDLLDRLDEIRHGLLIGGVPRAALQNLATMVRDRRQEIADPQLQEVLDEIELRAAVELAKYEQDEGPR